MRTIVFLETLMNNQLDDNELLFTKLSSWSLINFGSSEEETALTKEKIVTFRASLKGVISTEDLVHYVIVQNITKLRSIGSKLNLSPEDLDKNDYLSRLDMLITRISEDSNTTAATPFFSTLKFLFNKSILNHKRISDT